MLKLKRTIAVMMAAVFCLFALPQVMVAGEETYALQGTMGSLIEIMTGSGTWNGSDTTGQLNIQLRDPADGTIFTAYKLLNIQKAADSSMLEVSIPDEMQPFWNLYVNGSETGTNVTIADIKREMNITTEPSANTAAADIVNKFVTWSAGQTLTGKFESTLDGTNAKITAEFGFYAILQTGAPAGSYIASAPVLACLPMQQKNAAGEKEWISSYTVVPKDKKITVTKTVKAYGDAEYLDKTTTGMDDTVNFQIVADLPKYGADILAGTIKYTLEDTLPYSFSYIDPTKNNLTVEVSANGVDYQTLNPDTYSIVETLTAWKLSLNNYKDNFNGIYQSIRIRFDAPWVEQFVTVEGEGNTNKAKLTFTSSVNDSTDIEDSATVFTKRLDVNKVDADDNNIFLPGAEFEVYTSNAAEAQPLKFMAGTSSGDAPNRIIDYWLANDQTLEGLVTKVQVSADGKLRLEGLNDTTYYLKEVKAPEGYNLPKTLFDVTVATDTDNQSKTITNSKGIILPITGGMGTVLFTAIGLLLMVGAAYFLFRNKKQSN